ncbi:oxygen-dependent protoporphyrinogen oxidase [Arthrobacter woluwensis]|uniref:protoporphyrinogen oxidase n=1 Tax=Arthrobacter woluwensis TaxID=156980 RepID=UPI002782C909|nr:protoporphyrinogen oxidase [Arthrobacter woluwensis]MDQ0709452.1 oxygen-dependent protoporphyrinogen oxidase [Arthrobacter woluwensis]
MSQPTQPQQGRGPAPATAPAGVRRAVVVGGGVSGLLAAYRLSADGVAVTLVEARPVLGGAVGSHTVGGLTLDSGAESFATRGDAIPALLKELGLDQDVVAPHPSGAWVRLPQGPRELPKTGVLGIPADPWDEEVRRTLGWAGSLRASLDRVLPGNLGAGADVSSVARLVRLRQGRRVLQRLVEPVVGGVHAADPGLLDVDMVAPGLRNRMREHGSLGAAVLAQRQSARAIAGDADRSGASRRAGSAVAGLRGGMHRLVEALEARVREAGTRVLTSAAARPVSRDAEGVWTLPVEQDGAVETLRAEHLVVALDGPAAVELLASQVPALAAHRPEPGAQIKLVTLVVDQPELDARPRGTGILVAPQTQGVQAKALTHATAKWPWLAEAAGPGVHVLRLSYGRQDGDPGQHPESSVAVESDDELFQSALVDASELLGVPLAAEDVLDHDVVRWSGALPFAAVGHRQRVAAVRDLCAAEPGLDVVGAWLAGTGLAAVVADTLKIFTGAGTGSGQGPSRA